MGEGFGISVNPIRIKGADYARYITAAPPPIFSDDAASLNLKLFTFVGKKFKFQVQDNYLESFLEI